MQILLINDTSNTDYNPGCKATVAGLKTLLNNKFPNSTIHTIPLGVGYESFKNSNDRKGKFDRLLAGIDPKGVFYRSWKKKINNILKDYPEHFKKLKESDLVIVNMEGTIHSNRVGSLTLLGLAEFAMKLGKRVQMTNGTIQGMDKRILRRVLCKVEHSAVRESSSKKYLDTLKIPVHQGIDSAFCANINSKVFYNQIDIPENACLYTPGVLLAHPKAHGLSKLECFKIIDSHIHGIKAAGLFPIFFQIEESEDYVSDYLKQKGVSTLDFKDFEWDTIGSLLKKFRIIVSGRYHIIIFCLMNNMPFLALKSNSWKISGLFDLINYNERVLDIDSEIENEILKRLQENDSFKLDPDLVENYLNQNVST